MNTIIKKIIEDNIDLIENNNFDVVYENALALNNKINVGELTDIFYESGIDPLAFMTKVPSLFLDSSLKTTLVVPEHIKELSHSAFAYSWLEHVVLHDYCELAESAFYSSKIESITIPYIMNEVPEECFCFCTRLKHVDLNSVEQIGPSAFESCRRLKTIFIPDDINYIADSAFYDCSPVLLIHNNNEYTIEYCQRTGLEYKFV